MSLKQYDDLTGDQKTKVTKMYSFLGDLREYLYNFDDNGNYHGRTPTQEKAKEAPEVVEETKPKPTRRRRSKSK